MTAPPGLDSAPMPHRLQADIDAWQTRILAGVPACTPAMRHALTQSTAYFARWVTAYKTLRYGTRQFGVAPMYVLIRNEWGLVCRACRRSMPVDGADDAVRLFCLEYGCSLRARLGLYTLAGWHITLVSHARNLWRRTHGCPFPWDRLRDVALWKRRQAMLGLDPTQCDGLPGRATRLAMEAQNRFPACGVHWYTLDACLLPHERREPRESRTFHLTAVHPTLWKEFLEMADDRERADLRRHDATWSARGRAWAIEGPRAVLEDIAGEFVAWAHSPEQLRHATEIPYRPTSSRNRPRLPF